MTYEEILYPSILNDCGAYVCRRIEFTQRDYDKKWVRWEEVDTNYEPQERDHPFSSGNGHRYAWISTGVWNYKPIDAMKEAQERNKWRRDRNGYRTRIKT